MTLFIQFNNMSIFREYQAYRESNNADDFIAIALMLLVMSFIIFALYMATHIKL